MGIKVTTESATGILMVQAVDELEPEEALRLLSALYRGAAGRAPPAMLWDLSGASIAASLDVPSIASFVQRHRPNAPGCTAVVAGQDVSYGLARMGQAYLEDLPIKFQVFRNREEALSWLNNQCVGREDVSGLLDE